MVVALTIAMLCVPREEGNTVIADATTMPDPGSLSPAAAQNVCIITPPRLCAESANTSSQNEVEYCWYHRCSTSFDAAERGAAFSAFGFGRLQGFGLHFSPFRLAC